MPFLDVNVDNSKETLKLSIYRKLTHTGLYNKWSSLAPTKYKLNLIRSLGNKALKFAAIDNYCFLSVRKLPKCSNKTGIQPKLFEMLFAKPLTEIKNRMPNSTLTYNSLRSFVHFLNCSLLIAFLCKLKKKFVNFYVRMISNK